MDKLPAQVYSTIKKYDMTLPVQKVCVAISGGPDSTALLAILKKLEERLGVEIKACHYDHAYRPDSGEDCALASHTAQKLGVEIIAERNSEEKPASGLQLIARCLRYRFFGKLLEDGFADIIATGHTMDDSVETSIMWMIRGAGPHAFGGVPAVREKYIRPLIETRKNEVMAWLRSEGIEYKIDPTNLTHDYLRNRIRHTIIPAMETEAPRAVEAINRLALITMGQSQALDEIVEKQMSTLAVNEKAGEISLDCGAITEKPEAIRMSIYRLALKKIGHDLAGLTFRHFDSIDRLVTLASLGKKAHLPGGYRARVDHGGLTFYKHVAALAIAPIPFAPSLKERIGAGELTVSSSGAIAGGGIHVDCDKAPAEAVFRGRKPGDYLRLKNMEGRKSLKKFLIDRKTPSGERDRMILLAVEGEILWVPGLFLSPSIAADSETISGVTIRFDAS